MSSEITETTMQAVLMKWAMFEKNHQYVVPNSTMIFRWEADLVSVTRALFTHEYEIKISLADFRKDAHKVSKHQELVFYKAHIPNYFWYATFAFDITPPDHAGWIKITKGDHRRPFIVEVRKEAPRLSDEKLSEKKQFEICRLLSFRATNYYSRFIQQPTEREERAILAESLTQEQIAAL